MNRTRGTAALVMMATIALVGSVATPAFAASDKQIAKASTLKVSDLSGTAWTSTPHKESPDVKLPACAPTNKADKAAAKQGSAHSPDFSDSGGTQIRNTVYVFPSVKDAKAYLAAFRLPTALECLQQGADQSLQGSGETAKISDLAVGGAPKPIAEGVGFQGVITGVPASQNNGADVYLQAVAFRVGRAVTGLTTMNINKSYPETEKLVLKSVARLAKNLK